MVDQLNAFAAEVTRVAREVGTQGVLGGQAEVEGVSGTWRDLTQNVNQLAGNLTTQVRAIAEVSTAVTQGDLTRQISVDAMGEVAELSDTINQMIANLRETTQKNAAEQDWLNLNLARISGLMQGQRDLATVSRPDHVGDLASSAPSTARSSRLVAHRRRARAAAHRQLRLQAAQVGLQPLQARRGPRRRRPRWRARASSSATRRRTTSRSAPASARRCR